MACHNCKENWFWKKIGRCRRCMIQLAVLSVLAWVCWWIGFRNAFNSVESIALLFARLAFTGLLGLHLWFRWIVFPWQKRRKRK